MLATHIAFQGSQRTTLSNITPGAYFNLKHIRSVDGLFKTKGIFYKDNQKLFSKIHNSSSDDDDDDLKSITSDNFKGLFAPFSFVEEKKDDTTNMNSDIVPKSTSTNPTADNPTDKFTFAQKIESTKSALIGLFVGGTVTAPFVFLHDVLLKGATITNGFAQFEFDTDMGSIMAALFAIVYRYCVRKGEEKNEMLPMGVIGAFVLVRTLSRVRVSTVCTPVPLQCGAPIGYFDWDMLGQACFSGLESIALFGSVAYAMEYCYKKDWISRISN